MSDILIDSYASTNADGGYEMKHLWDATDADCAGAGQSFVTPASPIYTVTSFKLYLKKTGSPTGTASAKLYLGNSGTDYKVTPTGSALASASFNVATLTTDYVLYEFTFTTPYECLASTDYVVVLENPTSGTIDASNYLWFGTDSTGSGDFTRRTGDGGVSWKTGFANTEGIFYVYGTVAASGGAFLLNFI